MPTESRSFNMPASMTQKSRVPALYPFPPTTSTTQGYIRREFGMSRVSTSTPGFNRPKKGPRNLPMNAFSYTLSDYEYPSSESGVDVNYYSAYWGGFFGTNYSGIVTAVATPHEYPPISPTSQQLAALDSRAVTKLRNDLKNQSINLAQAYAERRMTADLIADTAIKLAKAISQVKKGNLRDAADTLGAKVSRKAVAKHKSNLAKSQQEAVASGWLQLQYGWTPLLNDIYGAAQFLAEKQFSEIIDRVTASSSLKIDEFRITPDGGGSARTRYQTDVTIKYGVYFGTNYGPHTLSQTGFSNPALIAWELMPWSFVVDWFLPIGNYLSSLDATLGLSFIKGYKTVFTRQSSKTLFVYSQAPRYDGNNFVSGLARDSWKKVSVQRSVLTDFPSAQLPQPKNPFSITHAANAIALMRQAFR
jgi:hypothetical protein